MNSQILSTRSQSLRFLFPTAEFFGASDICARGIATDPSACRAGDLYVAMVDVDHDGHDGAAEAVARGASAILAERFVLAPAPICVVSDARKAYGRLCQALHGNPSRELAVIGIAGAEGKTTTSCLVASVLAEARRRVGIIGSLGCCDSMEVVPAPADELDSHDLARWLRRMVEAGCTHAVVEANSRSLAQSRFEGVEFDIACITNIGNRHADPHGTVAGYRRTVRRILDHVRSDGLAIFNADDSETSRLMQQFAGPALSVGIENPAEVTATLLDRSRSEQTFLLTAGSETVVVRTAMIGAQHLHYCLLAATVGLAYDIDLPTIARGLEAVGHVPGRLERIECGQEFGVFVDQARAPQAIAAALKTLRDVTTGRLICVFGGQGEHDAVSRPTLGHTVEMLADAVIVTSDDPGFESPEAIVDDILSGCERPNEIEVVCDRMAAIRRAIHIAEPGDCVLIAGKGAIATQRIGGAIQEFDDREAARECLYGSCNPVFSFAAANAMLTGPN